eukprot:4658273-Amphidinium_carterae.2
MRSNNHTTIVVVSIRIEVPMDAVFDALPGEIQSIRVMGYTAGPIGPPIPPCLGICSAEERTTLSYFAQHGIDTFNMTAT